jgi:6-phosphogluconolactonase
MHKNIHVYDHSDTLFDALLSQWCRCATAAIADHGGFHVALAGGRTPRQFYEKLAQTTLFSQWHKVHIYFGDERCVAQDHIDSNYRMVDESLLSHVDIPACQIHALHQPSLSAAKNALRYQKILQNQLLNDNNGQPVFDFVLLGMGNDGHTASLFPETAILQEQQQSVAAQFVEKLDVWRLSLTYPVFNAARFVAVLVVGDAKSALLETLLSGMVTGLNGVKKQQKNKYPIQGITPKAGLQWYLDQSAAQWLKAEKYNEYFSG